MAGDYGDSSGVTGMGGEGEEERRWGKVRLRFVRLGLGLAEIDERGGRRLW